MGIKLSSALGALTYALAALSVSPVHAQVAITVSPSTVVSTRPLKPVGVVLNQMTDGTLSLDSLKAAVGAAGAKHLRFPEGESADNYYFTDPSTLSNPYPPSHRVANTAWWPTNTSIADSGGHFKKGLNFDQFMSVVNAQGAVANVVLCYPCSDKAMALEMAKAWVKYAMDKGYNVPYWEIGNETYYYNPDYTDDHAVTVTEYARDVIEWSAALKAINPNIKIGANGLESSWFTTLLTYKHPNLGTYGSQVIDFLSVHSYEIYHSTFANYQINKNSWGSVNFADNINKAQNAINSASAYPGASKIRVHVTECSTMNFTSSDVNNFGSAIMTVDMLTEMLKQPIVDYVEIWASRWTKNFSTKTPQASDTFSSKNTLNMSGKAISFLASNLGDKVVSVSGATTTLRAFASVSSATGAMSLVLINRAGSAQGVDFTISGNSSAFSAVVRRMTGSPTSFTGTFDNVGTTVNSSGSKLTVSVPSTSVMILTVGGSALPPAPAPAPAPAPGPNIVLNPGFESGVTNWSDWGNNGIVTGTSALSGTQSLRVGTGTGGRGQMMAGVKPNTTYALKFKAKMSASGDTAWVGVTFMDANGNNISKNTVDVTSTSALNYQASITAPAAFSSVQIWVWKNSGPAQFYVDDISFGTP